ncbi:E3 ubiquitin-protein ligase SIRP1-like [Gastrolobium bilobum]|uniref:E3 ubiquitin-protein ligase SIRP1-like n=1 Tax=Gastrolobium bilobum TaxID=150636 RepID=UPI002AB02754|nr:E3 ubiquitin-protein ligase SIRP1-like [Gastrolobium bilobum]
MENHMEGVHWCNMCSKMVNPMTEAENKCPFCETEFSEVMDNLRDQNETVDIRSAWVFSLYAPIFLGLMGAFSPSLASIGSQESSSSRVEEEVEQERENELVLGGRRRASTTPMMHLFRGLHVRMVSESENQENNRNLDSSILVIDSFNEGALIVRGPNLNHTSSPNENIVGSLNDFLVGSSFDLLLQHLAQNVPSGYSSVNPPAQKAAIEAMPSVTSEEKLQCTVCLDDIEIGSEAKEMPCKHKFHGDCIVSWLKLHSSCPVCRFQMPSEDSTVEAILGIGNGDTQNSELVRAREERTRNGRRHWFPMLQSFNNFLPSP